MRLAVLAIALLLSGCASGWSKVGATENEFAQDRYQCQMEVAAAYPVVMTQTSYGGGNQTPSRTNCQTYGTTTNCTTTPGVYTPPVQQTSDANVYARIGGMNSCLQSRGYTFKFN